MVYLFSLLLQSSPLLVTLLQVGMKLISGSAAISWRPVLVKRRRKGKVRRGYFPTKQITDEGVQAVKIVIMKKINKF